jgi:hypothetical protein
VALGRIASVEEFERDDKGVIMRKEGDECLPGPQIGQDVDNIATSEGLRSSSS